MNPTDSQWNALIARDAAAAGAIVCAVRTTGVYCRPGCPARTPLRRNVEVYDSCAAAEEVGYRPCKRCRPRGLVTPIDAAAGSAMLRP